jgi:hypothetical protein
MKTEIKSLIQRKTLALAVLAAAMCGLYGNADIAPDYHSYYEPTAVRRDYPAANTVEFDYGISDTAAGYLVPGIEVKVSRFHGNGEDTYGNYDSFRRFVKPIAAGLFQYGLLIVLALFVVVWLAVTLNKWQRPVHIDVRRRSVEHRHLAYLIHQRRMRQNIPNKGRKS